MIIGNGLLAKAFAPGFADNQQVTVFASGVSNSKEIGAEQFARERTLLETALDARNFLVYFSTCSVLDPDLIQTPYVRHKIEMERLVRDKAHQMAIFRLPQVVGHSANPYTLTNYLYQKINDGFPFRILLNAKRNLIDVDNVVSIANHLLKNHQADDTITNIACPFSLAVLDLVRIFETVLEKNANYDTVAGGGEYTIDTTLAVTAAAKIGIVFQDQYINTIIRKYYA